VTSYSSGICFVTEIRWVEDFVFWNQCEVILLKKGQVSPTGVSTKVEYVCYDIIDLVLRDGFDEAFNVFLVIGYIG